MSHRIYEAQSVKELLNIRAFFGDVSLRPPFCDRLAEVPVASVTGSATSASVFDIDVVYARLVRPHHLVAVVALRDYLDSHPLLGCP